MGVSLGLVGNQTTFGEAPAPCFHKLAFEIHTWTFLHAHDFRLITPTTKQARAFLANAEIFLTPGRSRYGVHMTGKFRVLRFGAPRFRSSDLEVRTDLASWWPLLAEGGAFCGANYTAEGPVGSVNEGSETRAV